MPANTVGGPIPSIYDFEPNIYRANLKCIEINLILDCIVGWWTRLQKMMYALGCFFSENHHSTVQRKLNVYVDLRRINVSFFFKDVRWEGSAQTSIKIVLDRNPATETIILSFFLFLFWWVSIGNFFGIQPFLVTDNRVDYFPHSVEMVIFSHALYYK